MNINENTYLNASFKFLKRTEIHSRILREKIQVYKRKKISEKYSTLNTRSQLYY
jgi:hypothetical protein